jgi:hypothetical protein
MEADGGVDANTASSSNVYCSLIYFLLKNNKYLETEKVAEE